MLDFVWFMTFSMIEFFGLMYFMLGIFRFKFFDNLGKVLYSSFTMSIIAYISTDLKLDNYSAVIHTVMIVFALIYVFNVSVLYSIKMAITSIVIYAVNVLVVLNLLYKIGIINSLESNPFSTDAFIVQTISAISIYIIGYILKFKRIGFTYIPISRVKVYWSPKNKMIIYGTFISFVSLSYALTSFKDKDTYFNLIFATTILVILGILLLILSYMRDLED